MISQKRVVCTKLDIYVLMTNWVDTSAGGQLVPKRIMRPVVRASALTSFIRYMYIFYCKLQFLNHVIIIKTKVLLAQAYVTMADFWLP